MGEMGNGVGPGYWDRAHENDGVREAKVRSLIRIIRESGWVLGPIVVASRGNAWFVADGHHRVEAARRLKIRRIPARLQTIGGQDTIVEIGEKVMVFIPER